MLLRGYRNTLARAHLHRALAYIGTFVIFQKKAVDMHSETRRHTQSIQCISNGPTFFFSLTVTLDIHALRIMQVIEPAVPAAAAEESGKKAKAAAK
jgi:hypothetical protein